MSDEPLVEPFSGPSLNPRLQWLNAPKRWVVDPEAACLRVWPEGGTDFWQKTHYGFEADSGHLLALDASGDFVLTARVRSRPVHQYDQAGLMVRVSPTCWLKTSVEFEPDGPNRLGAVVTNDGYSDWSTQSLPHEVETAWFRVRLEGSDCLVEWARDGSTWEQIRMAPLRERPSVPPVSCGLYACSPKGEGFEAEFDEFTFMPGRLEHGGFLPPGVEG
jgi:regulation of enolase protein 1 (concanavalin A-like superfamily)